MDVYEMCCRVGTSTIAESINTAIMSCRIQDRRMVTTVALTSPAGGVDDRGELCGDGRSGVEAVGSVGC